jgi:16S rRNA (uracil1498-N3)-methyltransferase
MDDIIDKLTQLGVENIIPMQTARVIALPSESSRVAKLERWKRIARTASEQSQRDRIPLISPVTEFESVLSGAKKFDLRLILTLQGDARNVRDLVEGPTPGSILLLIGPEGDFTPEEVNSAREAGIPPASLGRRILRVETAAIAATAYLSLTLGL